MKKQYLYLLAAGCFIAGATNMARAADLNLAWFNPDGYRDMAPTAGESAEAFRQRVFQELGGHLKGLAGTLPADQSLHLTVTDLDLAGDMELGTAATGYRKMRMVSEMHPPRISFSFQLHDAAGAVILQGEEQLQGKPLLESGMRAQRDFSFPAEKAMLDAWFKRRFGD
jgi:hypothetical protein